MKKTQEGSSNQDTTFLNDYKEGAKLFRKFVRRPGKYKDQEALLRVKMTGSFSGWRLKDELTGAFGMQNGDCLFMNDLYVLGSDDMDVQRETWIVDGMAEGEAADWIEEADITRGTVFEGVFLMRYEPVPGLKAGDRAYETSIAMLILKRGIKVVENNGMQENDDEILNISDSIRKLLEG